MPIKLPIVTENYLRAIPLPNHAASYTVIPNGFIIDIVYETLKALNLQVVSTRYVTSDKDQMALGLYEIATEADSDLRISFSWVNSYNKQHRFCCTVGAVDKKKSAYYIPGNIASFVRMHKGTADQEAQQNIIDQLNTANTYYQTLVNNQEQFKNVIIDPYTRAALLGNLFFEKDIFTTYQAGTVYKMLNDKALGKPDNLWDLYSLASVAIRNSHPSDWIDDHIDLYNYIKQYYLKVIPETVDEQLPGQMNLFESESPVVSETEPMFTLNHQNDEVIEVNEAPEFEVTATGLIDIEDLFFNKPEDNQTYDL